MTNPRIVVLLGMHHSGTSLTASILEALGVDFGSDFIPADEHSRKGYFEHAAISRAHIRLNRLVNRRPFTAAGLVDYPQAFWQSRQALEFIDEVEMLVRKELDRVNGIWGFKDPHTIKLLPLWQVLFDRLGITPLYILAVRHPSEVAASAVKREHINAAQGELIWLDHNVAALHNTGFAIPVVTDYAAWLSDPLPQAHRIMDALGLVWPDDDTDLQAALNDRIDQGLRLQKQAGNGQPSLALELYQQLLAVSAGTNLRQATEALVTRYRSMKQLFDPALALLEREYRLRQEKDRELQALNDRLEQVRRITNAFTATRSGALLQEYQMFRMRISNQPPSGAPLLRLKKVLNDE